MPRCTWRRGTAGRVPVLVLAVLAAPFAPTLPSGAAIGVTALANFDPPPGDGTAKVGDTVGAVYTLTNNSDALRSP